MGFVAGTDSSAKAYASGQGNTTIYMSKLTTSYVKYDYVFNNGSDSNTYFKKSSDNKTLYYYGSDSMYYWYDYWNNSGFIYIYLGFY